MDHFPESGEAREPAAQNAPVVLIPVTADDVARQKLRMRLSLAGAALAAALVAGYFYERWVDPIHARQSYEAGLRLYSLAHYSQAILAFDRAASLDPTLVDAILMRGRSNASDNRIDQALADFSRVIALRPNDTRALVARGREWIELRRYQSAVDDASRALAVDSRLAPAYNLRGMARRALGDPRKAVEDFTRAVELSPVTDNLFQRGATYQILGDHRRALADFDRMIAIDPEAASAYFARAESKLALGDARGAAMDHLQGRILDGR